MGTGQWLSQPPVPRQGEPSCVTTHIPLAKLHSEQQQEAFRRDGSTETAELEQAGAEREPRPTSLRSSIYLGRALPPTPSSNENSESCDEIHLNNAH